MATLTVRILHGMLYSMEIDREKLLNLLKSRSKYIRTNKDIVEAFFCLIGYAVTIALAFSDLINSKLWVKITVGLIGLLYVVLFLYTLIETHYSIETLFREICSCNNDHKFILAVFKNRGRFLLKFDRRWKTWLFPYTKADTKEALFDFITYDIGFEPLEIIREKETDVTKYSVSAGLIKTYHHTFTEVSFNGNTEKKAFKFNANKYRWFSIDEMKLNKRIMDTNKETVDFVEQNF